MKKIVIAICAVAMFASCATTKKATTLSALDGEWNVTEIKGKAVEAKPGENKPFIGFKVSEKRVYGSTTCNRLTGTLNADAAKGTIDFSALGMTRMMCPDMTIEDMMTATFGDVKSYKIKDGKTLNLCDAESKTVMVLNRK